MAVFASIAYGFVDLGLGISILRLDHPRLGEFSGSWWVLFINSAAFWTGLVLAASSTVVSSWVVYEWNIAPRIKDEGGITILIFNHVNLQKAFRELVEIHLWIVGIFTLFWLIFNCGDIGFNSGIRYFVALIAGSILLSILGRIAIIVLANIRDVLNEHHLAVQSGRPHTGQAKGLRRQPRSALSNALLAPFRQNYAAVIMSVSVLLTNLLLVKFGPVIPIATNYLLLLLIYYIFKALVYFTIIWRVTIIALSLLWIANSGFITNALGIWGDGRDYDAISHLNLQFPGFVAGERDFYKDQPKELRDLNGPGTNSGGPKPADRLRMWAEKYAESHDIKPVLVVISTSGGAYRAGFWTGLVLDKFMEQAAQTPASPFADLPESIRLITGASGGMVGASYFATRPEGDAGWRSIESLERDIECSQMTNAIINASKPGKCEAALDEPFRLYTTEIPLPRQTLSAVAQHTLENDLPSIFWGGWTGIDRGKVLEGQWLQLRKPVSFLGSVIFRPSIIFSPMIVDSGKQLLISDLDLSRLAAVKNREAVELFAHFPEVRETFNIRTAVRMQATFPYISPAVSLPTRQPNKVVDAGYYDNYGIVTAVQLLQDGAVIEVVRQKFAAVVIMEIRAFPDTLEAGRNAKNGAFDWASTPLKAVLSARGNSMNFRNRQTFRALQNVYKPAEAEPDVTPVPVHRLVFTNCTKEQSLNWFVPEGELAEMRESAKNEWVRNLPALAKIWERDPNAEATWGDGSDCMDVKK